MSESRLVVAPIDNRETFKDKAYTALRNVICSPRNDAAITAVSTGLALMTSAERPDEMLCKPR